MKCVTHPLSCKQYTIFFVSPGVGWLYLKNWCFFFFLVWLILIDMYSLMKFLL